MDTLEHYLSIHYGYIIACAREIIKETDRDRKRLIEMLEYPVIARVL
jgi:hypothetical protein|nr:MAG TPA: hypothetical protein [Caudoviricetes sp.]